jgi:hypothetical protein
VPEAVLDEHVRAGHLWEAAAYLGLLGEKRIRCGDFAGFEHVLRRNDELAEGFGYQAARLGGMGDQVYLRLEQGRFEEAIAAADAYHEESPQALLHLLALGARAEAQVRAGALDEAERTLARGETLAAANPPAGRVCVVVPAHNESRVIDGRARGIAHLRPIQGLRRNQDRGDHVSCGVLDRSGQPV